MTTCARLGVATVLTVAGAAGTAVHAVAQPGDIGWTASLVAGSLLYHPFTVWPLTPYALLGRSLARLSTGGAAARTAAELAVDIGAGFWLRGAGPLALRTDLRFIHIDNAPNFWRVVAGVTFAP